MAISLFTRSYGTTQAGLSVLFRNPVSNAPAYIYNASSQLINDQGLAKLDASGSLSVYVDTAVNWVVNVISDLRAENDEATALSPAQKAAGAVTLFGATADGVLVAPDGSTTFGTSLKGLVSGPCNATSAWRMESLVKLIAATPSFAKSTGLSVLDYCSTAKQEMEAAFVAVRFARINRGNQALANGQGAAFVTETMAADTSANLAFPKMSGTTYAQLAGATDQLGFRAMTWAGAAVLATQVAALTAPTVNLCDWIPIKPVARAAGEPSTRPVLGWRWEHLGSTNGNWAFAPISANPRTPQASMRGRTFVLSKYAAGGAIADLSTAKAFSLDTIYQDVYPIVRFAVPVFSVWGVGDSITACTGITADGMAAWGHKACADLSTPLRPVIWSNLGVASMASSDFWVNAKSLLAAGVPPPSMLVLNVGSINEYGSTPNVRQAEIVQNVAAEGVSICRQYGIPYLVMWGTLPNENISTSILDAVRVQANADAYAYSQAVRCIWLDTSGLGDGASPERWVPAYKFDPFHPNELGQDTVFVPRLTAIIKAAAGL